MKSNLKFTSSITLAPLQVLQGHMWLLATVRVPVLGSFLITENSVGQDFHRAVQMKQKMGHEQ
jgi:hypothetical protein